MVIALGLDSIRPKLEWLDKPYFRVQCRMSRYQNEACCTTQQQMRSIWMRMKIHFHMKGCTSGSASTMRHQASRKLNALSTWLFTLFNLLFCRPIFFQVLKNKVCQLWKECEFCMKSERGDHNKIKNRKLVAYSRRLFIARHFLIVWYSHLIVHNSVQFSNRKLR